MSKSDRPNAERYHDRVANIYDGMYEGNPYWELYDAVTWQHLRQFLPSDLATRVLDVGCGTGKWGLRLANSGYRVTLSDISQNMLDQARRKADELGVAARVTFHKADLSDLAGLPDAGFDFILAEGDPLSYVERPGRAVKALARVAAPNAILVASVDNRWAGLDHYLDRGQVAELETFLRTGQTEWLSDKEEDRFPIHMFWPSELKELFEQHGFQALDLLGKTVVVRRPKTAEELRLLEDKELLRRLVAMELRLGRRPDALGRAAHLQIVAKRLTNAERT